MSYDVSTTERAKHYRELAWRAYQQASRADDAGTMASYVCLAQHWRKLALFAEDTDAATRALEAPHSMNHAASLPTDLPQPAVR